MNHRSHRLFDRERRAEKSMQDILRITQELGIEELKMGRRLERAFTERVLELRKELASGRVQ